MLSIRQCLEDIANMRKAMKNVIIEELLWTNPSPTSNFTTKTLTLAKMSTYDRIKVMVTDWAIYMQEYSIPNIIGKCLICTYMGNDGKKYWRKFNIVANNKLEISEGFIDGGSAKDNSCNIPFEIYGIRKLGGAS